MCADRRPLLAAGGILLLFLAARAPLHLATWALPVSNDDAIPLLMARHVLQGEKYEKRIEKRTVRK